MLMFDEYSQKYPCIRMERRNGILLMTTHSRGGTLQWSYTDPEAYQGHVADHRIEQRAAARASRGSEGGELAALRSKVEALEASVAELRAVLVEVKKRDE